MILEGEFFSGGHLRWNLGWPTPNYAGAFLVSLLALAFVFSGSRWRWAILAVEAGGLLLLARTYSRGAVMAWGLAWLFGVVVSRAWRNPAQRLLWAARVGTLIMMLLAAGFGWSRAVAMGAEATSHGVSASDGSILGRTVRTEQSSEAPVTEDGSILNRLSLWRGGLEMIAAAPLHGWGAGESGRAYMNWFQNVDRTEGFATMVNSYLHVGVEHGLPMLGGLVFGLMGLLMVAARTAVIDRRYRGGVIGDAEESLPGRPISPSAFQSFSILLPAAGASLVAWAVANVFTTLWIEPKLWIVPGIACAMIVFCGWRNRRCIGWRWVVGMSAALAVVFVGGLLAAAVFLRTGHVWRVEPGVGRTAVVHSRELSRRKAAPTTSSEAWQVWPDTGVLGSTPGKELRRWIEMLPATTRVVVHPAAPVVPTDDEQTAGSVFLFGRQAERWGRDSLPVCRQLVLIHPRGMPPAKWAEEKKRVQVTVIVPMIDETGEAMRWQQWAAEQGARVVVSPGVGQDIRAAWPGVIGFLGIDIKEAR
jgi:hypothetical protein